MTVGEIDMEANVLHNTMNIQTCSSSSSSSSTMVSQHIALQCYPSTATTPVVQTPPAPTYLPGGVSPRQSLTESPPPPPVSNTHPPLPPRVTLIPKPRARARMDPFPWRNDQRRQAYKKRRVYCAIGLVVSTVFLIGLVVAVVMATNY
ncbi:hypothetical protein K504DRAFT_467199 [Pleomassaria siparia CBS 279.74]|uniref:Uncharacterized protein n=1 Tax=Pleomassaria siparia CBS 279.74 TaxID=1314801 RepID=A0A6G1K9T4_9PLEO|nr:hypothetical protein K504DRAFT_467199 [Pleomassaria siparia CBS 279.74]